MYLKLCSNLFYNFTFLFSGKFYLHICVLEQGYVFVSVIVCMHGGQRSTSGVFPQFLTLTYLVLKKMPQIANSGFFYAVLNKGFQTKVATE